MKYLLDTHVFLWILEDDSRLGNTARQAFLNESNELFFSMASYWEICIKISIGKLKLKRNWAHIFERELDKNAIQTLSISKEHTRQIIHLPWLHRDPFDRLIIAQCKCEKLTCITADEKISQYDLPCLLIH
jgi:PIN domain nuclease of toxin-antitoxin system